VHTTRKPHRPLTWPSPAPLLRHILFGLALQAAACSLSHAASADKPNIIVILSDDFGYGSAGSYGAPASLRTPNLDRLATEGRRFTQAYAPSSVCSPTRYGIMTGRYYWRTPVKDGEVLPANAPLLIETNRLTLGSLCKGQGYNTAAIGKWHIGLGTSNGTDWADWRRPVDWSASHAPGPLAVGFDYFYGLAANVGNHPLAYVEGDSLVDKAPGQIVSIEGQGKDQKTLGIEPLRKDDEVMRKLTDKAVDWIEQNKSRPFFLFFAPNAVHEPVTPSAKFTGSPYGKYGDFIEELDWSVGQILSTLDRLKLADNTLVIFTSDNGGVINPNSPNHAEAMKAGLKINGAWRGSKHFEWEGGFREPFLVRWPAKVPANTVSDQMICLTDVLATLSSILQVPLPDGPAAEDSLDVSRAFFETTPGKPVRDHVILQSSKGAFYAIRQGDWKLIERQNPPPCNPRNAKKLEAERQQAPKADQLFNLATDPAETKDVRAENEELAAKLRKLLVESRDQGRTRD